MQRRFHGCNNMTYAFKGEQPVNGEKSETALTYQQDWVAQTSIKFKSQLNLNHKLISCTFHVNLSVN